ncbi:hypothetical protein Z948_1816 [Sulfitobacter donghicola DSW-25 = KCTC 12864 = JCM 14565]|uniref:Uncharacterized protein n=1 Tax=Sulfitobacter donghicola DSW-25 = KCTC 12864 = JCM 14565 TaxID=1300350 RepID=A0A073J0A7_9RHOB|nr:hypothetical protein DSW25_02635 [Sulfitobacter donghicola DSW-25 = KCTC 12864 = JCM 14565]KIN68089.1 hypothetical protein Z948_1816 [Sulfitobacter donghicola DSW-25 = KCTC 12864 = JCM 14565]
MRMANDPDGKTPEVAITKTTRRWFNWSLVFDLILVIPREIIGWVSR